MALPRKTFTWIFVVAVILIIVLSIWFFSKKKTVPDPNKTNTPLPPGATSPRWVPESFPLAIGMYGSKIQALQTALGITPDGKFGTQTNGAIVAKGYSVPLSQTDYNAIVGTSNGSSSAIGKFAYAAKDGVQVYNKSDYSVYATYNTGDFIGKIVANSPGTSDLNYTINGGFIVPVADVTLQ